jgi:hypothetical protein
MAQRGVSGKQLLQFAGTIPKDDLERRESDDM